MARMMQPPEDLAELYEGPEYATCIICGHNGRVRHSASKAREGMIVRCLHARCYKETKYVYLCDGFTDCAGAHRQVSHPIQCRAGGDDRACGRPVLDQKLVGATLRDTRHWQKGFYCCAHLVEAKRSEVNGNKQWAKLPEAAGYGMETGPQEHQEEL